MSFADCCVVLDPESGVFPVLSFSVKNRLERMGQLLQADITFYNSLASAYLNDYNDRFKSSRFKLAVSVLERAIIAFPAYPGFYSYLSSIKMEEGDKSAARKILQQAVVKLNKLRFANPELIAEERASIAELQALLK